MAKTFLALTTDFESFIISIKYRNFTIFEPFLDRKKAALAFNEGCEKELFKEMINEFKTLCENSQIVIVKPVQSIANIGFVELNLKIAQNLNTPIFTNENLSYFSKRSKLIISNDLEYILNSNQNIITPFAFENALLKMAKEQKKTIVLPESCDDRILKASEILLNARAVNLILLGNENEINARASELGLNLNGVRIIDLDKNEYRQNFANELYELRKNKAMSKEEALNLMQDRTYFATMLVQMGIADAMVSGASTTTAQTIRPALQIIKTTPDAPLVSSSFIMCFEEEIAIFADCAINPNPDPKMLACIAIQSAKTAIKFGLEPRIAFLSYSSGESGSGNDVELVRQAGKIALEMEPNLKIEFPIQYDAAVDLTVAAKKMPNSKVAGLANVFIFPNLNAGNIGYKIAQRVANALAIGPILQGLKKPVNDLSRGCLVDDIVNTVLISAIQARS
ncbi:MAG: phosphate acetyltransferase [Campylobacter sp.]